MDWKEILLAKSAEMGIAPTGEPEAAAAESAPQKAPDYAGHPALHIAVERKGRGGKTATIIAGFECPPEQLRQIAARLKSVLGTGGSARGGEILIQGDCRDRVRQELKALGFRQIR